MQGRACELFFPQARTRQSGRVAPVTSDGALPIWAPLALPVRLTPEDCSRPEQFVRPPRRWQSRWRPRGQGAVGHGCHCARPLRDRPRRSPFVPRLFKQERPRGASLPGARPPVISLTALLFPPGAWGGFGVRSPNALGGWGRRSVRARMPQDQRRPNCSSLYSHPVPSEAHAPSRGRSTSLSPQPPKLQRTCNASLIIAGVWGAARPTGGRGCGAVSGRRRS